MPWVQIVVFTLLFSNCWTKDEELNDISSQPPINLDAKLRRALLKALTELENEENLKREQENLDNENHTKLIPLAFDDKTVEKAPASSVSFFANSEALSVSTSTTSFTTESFPTSVTTTEKPLIVIQKSDGIQQAPITSFIQTETESVFNSVNDTEQIVTSASSSYTSPDKYVFVKDDEERKTDSSSKTNSFASGDNFIVKTPRTTTQKVVVTTPTTTFKPTEESEAKVEDVQFFSAPLVAAFTVHQDERGLPKKVEPIFKQVVPLPDKKTVEELKLKEQKLKEDESKDKLQIEAQLDLQEKQKALELQIRTLQQQQQHQDYLLRQQLVFQEQQLQLQRQKILDEQARLQANQLPFIPIPNPNQNQLQHFQQLPSPQIRLQFRNNASSGTLVSFEPSLTFNAQEQNSNSLPLNAQQLPVKKAGDFHKPFFAPNRPLLQPVPNQSVLPSITNPPFIQPITNAPLIQPVTNPPLLQPIHPTLGTLQNFKYTQSFQSFPTHNRIFRHEVGTANFLNANSFTPPPLIQPLPQNTFFGPFDNNIYNLQPPVVNQHLNNLLYNAGVIKGRPQEDLSIVSKVLSLNHLGSKDNFFGGSTISEQRVIPILKKVSKNV